MMHLEYSDSYTEAREKIRELAITRGGIVSSYRNEGQVGIDGEELYLDVIWFGPKQPARLLIVSSGTHGVEGYAGSAVQQAWIRRMHRELPVDTAIMFIHAINPWGFSFKLRTNENNVDLNRNFIDFTKPLPTNHYHNLVEEIVDIDQWTEDCINSMFLRLRDFRERIGEQEFSNSFNGGQYVFPNGIFYGGNEPQWSNLTFSRVLKDHVSAIRRAALIDLHTGIGPSDSHVFLCFHPPDTPAHNRVRQWWGERAVNRAGVTHKAVADYKGLLVNAFSAYLSFSEITAVVVEFGTLPREMMQRAAIAGSWLRRHLNISDSVIRSIKKEIEFAYYPKSKEWRSRVLEQGVDIINKGLLGLGR